MKMSKLSGGVVLIVASAIPAIGFSQANISRPRTGSPVIPGGAAIPGGQAVPIPDPADPTPDALPGLELLNPLDRERRAVAAAQAAAATTTPLPNDRRSSQSIPGRSHHVQDLIVSHLQISSLATIELNQFAAERATGSDVREFAETLVSDQQHFWRALERLDNSETTAPVNGAAASSAPSNNALGRPALTEAERNAPTQLGRTLPIERQIGQSPIGTTLPDQFPLSRRPPAQSLTPPADGGIRYGGTLPPSGGETRVPENEVVDDSLLITRDALPVTPLGETPRTNRSNQSDLVMNQLITIADRSAQSQLAFTKELLVRNEGEQFDKRFVAMQLADLIRVFAHLRAVRDIGSDEFREIIQTAEELTQSHLAFAEALDTSLNQR